MFIDTTITDTTIIFGAEQIYFNVSPSDTFDINSGGLTIWAQNGSLISGKNGNATGDGTGFFLAETETEEISFDIIGWE